MYNTIPAASAETISAHERLLGGNTVHRGRLAKFLRLAEHAGPTEKRQILATLPRDLAVTHDGRVQPVRELLQGVNVSDTPLIQAELYRTVIEGSRPYVCMRQATMTVPMKSSTLNPPAGAAAGYMGEVAEGADIPAEETFPEKKTVTAKKYGVRPLISQELVDDGEFDAVALHISHFGAVGENTLNRLVLTELLDNAGQEHDAEEGATVIGLPSMARARGQVAAEGFQPDTVIMHPDLEALVLEKLMPNNAYYQVGGTFQTGVVPNILGMKAYTCGVADASSTHDWDYDSDGEMGGLVIDSRRACMTGIRRDISVERYKDNVKDLVGLAISMRVGVEYMHANAICRMEY